jgi:hypothetical protein
VAWLYYILGGIYITYIVYIHIYMCTNDFTGSDLRELVRLYYIYMYIYIYLYTNMHKYIQTCIHTSVTAFNKTYIYILYICWSDDSNGSDLRKLVCYIMYIYRSTISCTFMYVFSSTCILE